MKIAFFSAFYGDGLGGAEISTEVLMNSLIERSHEVLVVTTRKADKNMYKNAILLPFSNYIPKNAMIGGSSIIDFYLSYHIEKFLRKYNPDIVHIHDLYSLPAAMNATLKLELPVIVTVRDPIPRGLTHSRNFFTDNLYRLIYEIRNRSWIDSIKKADKIIAISQSVKNSLEKLQISSSKIEVIYNLPPYWYTDDIEDHKKESDKIILITTSRLYEEKGIHILLDAMNKIIKDGIDNIELLIIGEGPHKNKLQEFCKINDIEKYIRFIGKIPYNSLQQLYSNCDIVIFPSIYPEPLGRVIIEAGIASKPVIATNVGGIPEIVKDGVTGILVPPNNPEKLANAVIKLIKDDKLRKEMGKNGKIFICKKLNPGSIIDKHIELYKNLV